MSGKESTVALDDADPYEPKAVSTPQSKSAKSTWVSIDKGKDITRQLAVMWNEETLKTAANYSAIASIEIWEWRLCQARLTDRRSISANDEASLGRLHLRDLSEIDALPRVGISLMDQVASDNFHLVIPETAPPVTIVTGSFVVGASIAMLMLLLVAYFQAAISSGAIETPGTIFVALHGSVCFEFLGLMVTWIPMFALLELTTHAGSAPVESARSVAEWSAMFSVVCFGAAALISEMAASYPSSKTSMDFTALG